MDEQVWLTLSNGTLWECAEGVPILPASARHGVRSFVRWWALLRGPELRLTEAEAEGMRRLLREPPKAPSRALRDLMALSIPKPVGLSRAERRAWERGEHKYYAG